MPGARHIFLPDRHGPNDTGLVIDVARVSSEYFPTLGVSILQGRNFMAGDAPQSLIEALRNDALGSPVPNPQLAPEWKEQWYGD